jgi:hypothetical protein
LTAGVVVAWAPRARTATQALETYDETLWLGRSARFVDALASTDLGAASAAKDQQLATMPGVTTMWTGALGPPPPVPVPVPVPVPGRGVGLRAHPYLRDLMAEGDAQARIDRFTNRETVDGVDLQVLENTATADDVILMHPLLLHTRPTNAGTTPRLLLNKDLLAR